MKHLKTFEDYFENSVNESFIDDYGVWPFNILSKKMVDKIKRKVENMTDEEKLKIIDKIINKFYKRSKGTLLITSIVSLIGAFSFNIPFVISVAFAWLFIQTLLLSLAKGLDTYREELEEICDRIKEFAN